MFKRRRAVLAFLEEAGGEASHLLVTNWAFLLREECASHGGSAFYEFLPYKWGPYSFCLFHEVKALARDGYVKASESTWALTQSGAAEAAAADGHVRADICDLVQVHSSRSSVQLLGYIRDRFPWYAVTNDTGRLATPTHAEPAVYTAGYEGLQVDGFLNGLLRHGIDRLIDVRRNPASRRYGFHKSTLSQLCERIGIEYEHFPELGIAREDRQDLERPGAREALFDRYEKTTLTRESEAIDAVVCLVKSDPSVLVCMEACPQDCHRSRLAKPVAQRAKLPIRHLELRPT